MSTPLEQELASLEFRLRAILPETYQDRYEEVQPVSMGTASLKYGDDGRVAWDDIWGSFCDLAMAGGPPHKGRLLEPASPEEIAADPAGYQRVVDELRRGIRLVANLEATPAPIPGWLRVDCLDATCADWLARAIIMENVSVRTEGTWIDLPAGPADELFTLDQAAAHIGVDTSYLRRLAAKTATSRPTETPPPSGPTSTNASPAAHLDAVKDRGRWRVTRAEIDRFVDARHQPQVVIGYDITFSAPKSLSILWATGSPEVRALCEEAFDAGVAAGVDYLERHAIWVRRGRGARPSPSILER